MNRYMHSSIFDKIKVLAEQMKIQKDDPQEQHAILAALSHLLQSPVSVLPYADSDLRNKVEQYVLKSSHSPGILQDQKSHKGEPVNPHCYTSSLLSLLQNLYYAPPKEPKFHFIDLFAGIGGFRIAFQNAGGQCLFSSEWDKFSQQTYTENFGEIPYGDIQKIDEKEIPDHDILCAGFPCQPFSIAGVSKKNALGRKHGFDDETQGTLFFDIKRILKHKRPKAFMLENVKNLVSHDKGRTFEIIRRTLEEELGYVINWKIVDASAWVPQHRERIFIVGYDPKQVRITKDEIVIPSEPESDYQRPQLDDILLSEAKEFTLGEGTWNALKRHKEYHAKAGNGFGYGLISHPISPETVTRTISARYHKDGAEILIEQPGDRPRRLTVSEAMQLQGYDPQYFRFPVSKTQAYRQIGNSVAVPAVAACAREMVKVLREKKYDKSR